MHDKISNEDFKMKLTYPTLPALKKDAKLFGFNVNKISDQRVSVKVSLNASILYVRSFKGIWTKAN
jgi:hypothetical protein